MDGIGGEDRSSGRRALPCLTKGVPFGAEAEADLGGLALTKWLGVPAGTAVTIAYQLARPDVVERIGDDRLRYRLLLRPLATVRPDEARVAVTARQGGPSPRPGQGRDRLLVGHP